MTFMYGDLVVELENVWERLTRIRISRSGPQFIIDDCNEIIGNHKNKCGKKRLESSFLPFRVMIHNYDMIDFSFQCNQFSWVGRRSNIVIKYRLDKAMGNEE